MPNQRPEGALVVGERVRAAVEQLNTSEVPRSGASYVTVSVGAAFSTCKDTGCTVSLIAAADEAMYRAKTSGRDCVVGHEQ